MTDQQPDLSDLILDRIDALKVLRAETEAEKGALLEQIAGSGKVEQDIVRELAKPLPLFRPDRFEEAHRLAVRSLEVLDRNGARPAKLPRLGPLAPVVGYVVGLMTRWIVRGYQNKLIEHVRELYERREANCVWGSKEHVMLRRARIDMTRVEQGFRGNPLGLPTFLLGGAVLSGAAGVLNRIVNWAFGDDLAPKLTVFITIGILLLGLAWSALFAAGVARRRIRLCCDQPVKALWETVGAAGTPPKDDSYNFAVYAVLLLVLAAVLIPVVVGTVFF